MLKLSISIRRGLFILLLVLSTVSILLISGLWIYSEIKRNNREEKKIEKEMMESHKQLIKNKVESVITHIEFIINSSSIRNKKEMQELLLSWISTLHFENGGYVFVNTYSGNALVFDGKKVNGIMNVSDMTDIEGFRLFDEEKRLYNKKGGGYFTYKFKKMNSDIIAPKISFVKGFKKWQWIIGSGIYIDDVNRELAKIKEYNERILWNKLIIIFGVFIGLVLTVMLGTYILSKYIYNEFNEFKSIFDLSSRKHEKISIKNLNIVEFKELAKIANKMVDDRRIISSELKEKNEQYQTVVEKSLAGIYITQNHIVKFCNQRFADIFGYSSIDEITGKNVKDIVIEDSWHKVKSEVEKREKGTKIYSRYEITGLKKNGDLIDIEVLGGRITYNGKVAIQGTLLDISERKRAVKDVIESEKKLRTIFNAAENVSFITTEVCEDGLRIIEFSPGAENIFGYAGKDIIGENISILHNSEVTTRPTPSCQIH